MKEFKPFEKIARLKRGMVVTEKIDGTNAQVHWDPVTVPTLDYEAANGMPLAYTFLETNVGPGMHALWAGSRNRWLGLGKLDNFGFAGWVLQNMIDLTNLGPGSHFGEWWGSGIQRGYGLPAGEKRFSLFNVGRWLDVHAADLSHLTVGNTKLLAPPCCHVVPILYQGDFDTAQVEQCMANLRRDGSSAAKFMNPEGVVIYHAASRTLYKKTFEKDDQGKGE